MRKRSQFGISLIEVMVALVVLSIGLLGLALLQLRSLQNTHAAYQVTLATAMATDAEERLWLARAALAAGVVAVDTSSVQQTWRDDWTDVLAGSGVASTITDIGAAGGEYEISVGWTDARFGGAQSFSYRVTLP